MNINIVFNNNFNIIFNNNHFRILIYLKFVQNIMYKLNSQYF